MIKKFYFNDLRTWTRNARKALYINTHSHNETEEINAPEEINLTDIKKDGKTVSEKEDHVYPLKSSSINIRKLLL